MSIRLTAILTFAALAAASLHIPSTDAAVIYRENFTNTTGSRNLPTDYGWNHYSTGSATLENSDGTGGIVSAGATTQAASRVLNGVDDGLVEDEGLVFAGNSLNGGANGFGLFTVADADNSRYGGSLAVADITSIGFDMSLSGSTDYRVAIKIGDDWFASNATFSSPTNGNWESKSLAFTTTAVDWLQLTFTPGSTLSLGAAAVSDLTGFATEFGVYYQKGNNTGTVRLDNFEINAIPEPASLALIGLAALCLLPRRRG